MACDPQEQVGVASALSLPLCGPLNIRINKALLNRALVTQVCDETEEPGQTMHNINRKHTRPYHIPQVLAAAVRMPETSMSSRHRENPVPLDHIYDPRHPHCCSQHLW